eukprot:2898969-Rhodomonas_salina.1
MKLPEPPRVWLDAWEKVAVIAHETQVEIFQAASSRELHLAILARRNAQSPLIVLAKDEEISAYVRTLKMENPSWNVTRLTVENGGAQKDIPSTWEEDEWQKRGGD